MLHFHIFQNLTCVNFANKQYLLQAMSRVVQTLGDSTEAQIIATTLKESYEKISSGTDPKGNDCIV